MRIKGIQCTRAYHITFRRANPAIDRDIDGDPVEPPYVSFVYVKDCPRENGVLMRDQAPAIPVSHGATYYGYGQTRSRNAEIPSKVYNSEKHRYEYASEYFTTPFYAAHNGYVYQGTLRHLYSENTGNTYYRIEDLNARGVLTLQSDHPKGLVGYDTRAYGEPYRLYQRRPEQDDETGQFYEYVRLLTEEEFNNFHHFTDEDGRVISIERV